MDARLLIVTGCVAFAVSYGQVAPASATIVNAEWTGTVASGVDGLGIFGPAGADLSGAAFTGDMLYDTALGTTLYSSPTGTWLEGGPGVASGGQSPILTASITINAVTHAITPNFTGQILASNGQPNIVNEIYQYGASSVDNDNIFFAMYNYLSQISGDIPGTIDVPLTYNLGPNDFGYGQAQFGGVDGFSFSPTTVTYSLPSGAVPEPSTWALMLLGFVGLSVFGYRRTRTFVPAELV